MNNDILARISLQYYDIVSIIFSFIPLPIRRQWNRKYHTECSIKDPNRLYTFTRTLIRNDHYFTFNSYLKKHYSQWSKRKLYIYKNMKFYNYIEFIRYFCRIHNSSKCQGKILDFEKKIKGKTGKKYKKIKIRNIGWNN